MESSIIDYSNLNRNQKLYKYMDLEKFLSLIVRKELCFCSQSKLKEIDPYEGASTEGELFEELFLKKLIDRVKASSSDLEKLYIYDEGTGMYLLIDLKYAENVKLYYDDLFYVDCWHINNNESLAMWKVFSNNKNSIAISTTKEKLIHSLLLNDDEQIVLQNVTYSDISTKEHIYFDINDMSRDKNTMYITASFLNGFDSKNGILRKTKYYEYEKELRLYTVKYNTTETVLFINLDLNLLIDEIIISPNCDDWFLEILKDVVSKYGLNKKIIYSDIKQNNITIHEESEHIINDYLENIDFILPIEETKDIINYHFKNKNLQNK